MSEATTLFTALKSTLKARGKTYRDLAAFLGLSESTVKRIFANSDLSLKRLEQICGWLGITIADLTTQAEQQQPRLSQLTTDQEQIIVDDSLLLLVTTCVMNQWRFDEITGYYQISEPVCIQKLALLDRLGLIELLPDNRIKLLIAPNFCWLPNGPIQQFFQNSVAQAFFNCAFAGNDEQLIVLNGTLSEKSNIQFQQRMARLASEFNDLGKEDLKLPLQDRHGTTAVIAIRKWSLAMFDAYKKAP